MNKKENVNEWIEYAEMDILTAEHLFQTMYPKPLPIICYHCQQAVEKMLKGALVLFDVGIRKTHDLGALVEELDEFIDVEDSKIDQCYDLTIYGVKSRYPQELWIEEHHAEKALKDAKILCDWLKELIADRLN